MTSISCYLKSSIDLSNLQITGGWERKFFSMPDKKYPIIFSDKKAEPLCIHLNNTKGTFKIHIGIYLIKHNANSFQLKLSSSSYWRKVMPMNLLSDPRGKIQNADLGTHALEENHVLQIRTEFNNSAAIAYIHLEPVTSTTTRKKNKNVGVVLDMAEFMGHARIDEPNDLLGLIEPYRDSDFTHIFWGNAVGTYSPLYFSDILGYHGESDKQLADPQLHRRNSAHVMRMFKDKNIDPLAMAIEYSHKIGLELWSNDRISKNHNFDWREDTTGGRFLLEHQDKRVLNSDRQPDAQHGMSFAYPEIRENKINFLAEQAEMGVDGIFIDFLRFYPIIGWEEKVCQDFQKEYGEDIFELKANKPAKEWGPNWLKHQASYLTLFMRELRERIDSISSKKGKKLPIGAQILGKWRWQHSFMESYMHGLDIKTWAKEGLVDFIAPVLNDCLWHEAIPFDRIQQQLDGTKCKIWGSIGSFTTELYPTVSEIKSMSSHSGNMQKRYLHPERIARCAYDYFNQNADGVFIWEGEDTASIPTRWNIIKDIGNMDSLQQKFGLPLSSYDGKEILEQIEVRDLI